MTVLTRFVRDRRRSVLWWSIGVVGLVLMTVAFFPSIRGQQSFEDVYKNLPDSLKAMLGTFGDVPITSAPGYLQGRLYGSLLPLLLLIFGIGAGGRAMAGSEEDGTLELLLANPVTRARVIVERYLAVVALIVVLTAVSLLSVLVLGEPFGALEDVRISRLVAATCAAGMLALVHASITFGIGAAYGKRSLAVGTATSIAVAGYLMQGLLSVADTGRSLRVVSPWHWYLGRTLLIAGPAPIAFVLPLAVSLVSVAVGGWRFVRRDLR